MALYNPNDQCIIGPEWYPHRRGVTVLDSDLKSVGYILTASTSDDVGYVWNFLQQQTNDYSVINMEIFDITDGEVPLTTPQNFVYYPGSDLFVGAQPWTPGSFQPEDPSLVGPYYSCIDSPVLTPGIWPNSGAPVGNDQFVFNFYGEGADFAVTFADVAGTQDGRWVTRVRQRFVCAQYLALGAEGAFEIQPYMFVNGTKCTGPRYSVSANDGISDIYHDWYYQPLTGAPWTTDDIDRFDTSYGGPYPGDPYWEGQMGLGWIIQPTGSSNNLATILQGQMIVESSPTDPRIALGSTIFPPKGQGWKAIAVRNTATFDQETFTLVPGRRYFFLIRRGNSLGPIAPSYLVSIDGNPIPGSPLWTSSTPKLDGSTRRPVQIGPESSNAYGILLETDLGSNGAPDYGVRSDDSQPWTGVSPPDGASDDYPWLGNYFPAYLVNEETELRQAFTVNDANDYGWIWVVASRLPSQQGSDLVITVRDTATDTIQGSPATISIDELSQPNRWYKIGVRLPGIPPTLADLGPSAYYLEFTSTVPDESSWIVQVMRYDAIFNYEAPFIYTNNFRPLPFFGYSYWNPTDYVYYGPPGDLSTVAKVRTVASITTIPPGLQSSLTVAATAEACNFSYMQLAWTQIEMPDDCVGFGWYEIERSYDQANWDVIAQISDIEVVGANDIEMRSNTLTYYRIRVVRADGAPSDWSTIVSATAPMSSPGLSFTSNAAPQLTVGYQDIGQTREFSFAENFEVFQPQGQDYQVFYREIEDRGVSFNAKLRIRAGREACLPLCDQTTVDLFGDDVFGPLKAICREGLPYVCVRNESGNVWYAFVTTPSGQWTQHGMEVNGGFAAYTMDIEVTQVTRVPEPFDAEAQ